MVCKTARVLMLLTRTSIPRARTPACTAPEAGKWPCGSKSSRSLAMRVRLMLLCAIVGKGGAECLRRVAEPTNGRARTLPAAGTQGLNLLNARIPWAAAAGPSATAAGQAERLPCLLRPPTQLRSCTHGSERLNELWHADGRGAAVPAITVDRPDLA